MSYSDFTLKKVKMAFQLRTIEDQDLFSHVESLEVSRRLTDILEENVPLALSINTEKARSEFIIANVMVEIRRIFEHKVSIFSGIELNIDKHKDLSGFCDFVISASPEQFFLSAPVVTIVEAKNENINRGMGNVWLRCMLRSCSTNARETVFLQSMGPSQRETIGNF